MADKLTGSGEADTPQTTPPTIGYGHPEYHFIQAIMELQKSIGELTATVQSLSKTIYSTEARMSELMGDFNDAEIARERLREIAANPDSLVSGHALETRLNDLLAK